MKTGKASRDPSSSHASQLPPLPSPPPPHLPGTPIFRETAHKPPQGWFHCWEWAGLRLQGHKARSSDECLHKQATWGCAQKRPPRQWQHRTDTEEWPPCRRAGCVAKEEWGLCDPRRTHLPLGCGGQRAGGLTPGGVGGGRREVRVWPVAGGLGAPSCAVWCTRVDRRGTGGGQTGKGRGRHRAPPRGECTVLCRPSSGPEELGGRHRKTDESGGLEHGGLWVAELARVETW